MIVISLEKFYLLEIRFMVSGLLFFLLKKAMTLKSFISHLSKELHKKNYVIKLKLHWIY